MTASTAFSANDYRQHSRYFTLGLEEVAEEIEALVRYGHSARHRETRPVRHVDH